VAFGVRSGHELKHATICTICSCIIWDFCDKKEFVDHCSLQGQRMGSDFNRTLLCDLYERKFERYKLMDIVKDDEPFMIGIKVVCVSLL
jgi:hypothetical protein